MKAFIFKPANGWSFCDGGLVILAESLEDCQKLTDQKLFASEEEADESGLNWDFWVLAYELECQGEKEPRVIFEDYHWA